MTCRLWGDIVTSSGVKSIEALAQYYGALPMSIMQLLARSCHRIKRSSSLSIYRV
jgi:hypothetical protein